MIREATLSDLDRCFEIENLSYDGDEAASKEKIKRRIEQYPEGFILMETEGRVVGFINSGATNKVQLSDESIKEMVGHSSDGSDVVIMSVVVHPGFQGKGYAKLLMKDFVARMSAMKKSRLHLICQEMYLPFYRKFGFELTGPSHSNHGGMKWYEMVLTFNAP